VWLYFRFCLSVRDVEELLLERGVVVTYEAIRKWCRKFGQQYANQLRRRRPRPGDKWHLHVEHRQHRYLNNRAENSYQPTRQREWCMRRFNPRVRRSVFSRPMVPSRSISAYVVIGLPRPPTITSYGHDSRSGRRSQLYQ
jgi:transposase-like protein